MLQIAQVLKSNGTDGELVLGFRDVAPEDIKLEEPVFIEFDGLPVPFFIESLTKRGNSKALVRITDIESYEDAEEIVGRAVYVSEDSLEEREFEEGDYSFLIGWTLLDYRAELPEGGELDEDSLFEAGEITDFLDIPNNPCIEIEKGDGEETIIPLHQDLIISVDPENSEIIMRIPEGLLF